jgi:hypothetical protein
MSPHTKNAIRAARGNDPSLHTDVTLCAAARRSDAMEPIVT